MLEITQTRKSRERKVSRLRKLSGEKFGKNLCMRNNSERLLKKESVH